MDLYYELVGGPRFCSVFNFSAVYQPNGSSVRTPSSQTHGREQWTELQSLRFISPTGKPQHKEWKWFCEVVTGSRLGTRFLMSERPRSNSALSQVVILANLWPAIHPGYRDLLCLEKALAHRAVRSMKSANAGMTRGTVNHSYYRLNKRQLCLPLEWFLWLLLT